MTTTPTTDLASLLNAKRVALEAPPEDNNGAQFIDGSAEAIVSGHMTPDTHTTTVTEHGEIVPATPVPVAEYEPQYPSIPPKVVGGLPYVRDYMKLARTIHSTEMVPVAFRGRPDAILACFLRGYELGFGPMQALDSFTVIEGKVGLSAEAMRALIMDNGHQIILSDLTNDQHQVVAITAKCHRSDWPGEMWESYTFSLEDARVAGLLGPSRSGKPTAWQKYPRAMLDARATSGAGRRYFADVLAGMSYTPEEIRDFSSDQEVTPSQPTDPPPPPAPAPISSDNGAELIPAADSTESAPATSSAIPDTAPATASEPPAEPKKATRTRKAAPPKPAEGAVDSDVRLEMRKGLTALINELPPLQQPLVRGYLASNGYGDVTKLTPEQIQEAINIVAGWPDTMTGGPDEADDDVVDAEVVEDDGTLGF